MKQLHIQIDPQPATRLLQRSQELGLSLEEAQERAFITLKTGRPALKHRSKEHITYYRYFPDNLCVYVIFKQARCENQVIHMIKTVIIEKGRE